MRLSKSFFRILTLCTLFLFGCSSLQPKKILSSVDSIAKPNTFEKKRYVLMPGDKGIDLGDLQFQEFSGYIDKVLVEKGFKKVLAFQEADIALFLTYAIGDPQTYKYSYSLPTWGQTGVSSAYSYGSVSTYGNMGTYAGTTTYTPTYGVTGSTTHVATNTVYTRFLFLDAYDLDIYAKENKMMQVWKTNVISTGSSNDLRLVMPYMVTSMKPYLGTNTGRKLEVEIVADDPAVLLLRSSQTPPVK